MFHIYICTDSGHDDDDDDDDDDKNNNKFICSGLQDSVQNNEVFAGHQLEALEETIHTKIQRLKKII